MTTIDTSEIDVETLAKSIDHTLLYKDHVLEDIDTLVEEANRYGMNICIPPCRVSYVNENYELGGELATVIGFPHGMHTPEAKADEAIDALQNGATELDMACNVSELKSGNYDTFRRDVETVVEAADGKAVVKAIIETGIITDEEKKKASKLCVEAGADYVKTCTGFSEGQATVEDVELIKETVGDDAKVKASGGVGSYSEAKEMFEAGATRIGASSGVEIMESFPS